MKRPMGPVWMLCLLAGCGSGGDDTNSNGTLTFPWQDSENNKLSTDQDSTGPSGDGDVDADTDSDTDADGDGDGDSDNTPPEDTDTGITEDTDHDADTSMTTTDCLTRTPDEATCLTCCDCKTDACEDKADCRNACPDVDYGRNDDYLTFDVPSVIGAGGDYLDCFMRGEEGACKQCCDCSRSYQCGDLPHCRLVCESIF